MIEGDTVGRTLFYGRGAGRDATASAVVADVMDCAAHMEKRKPFGWESGTDNCVADYNELETVLYVRAEADDKAAAMRDVAAAFADAQFIPSDDAREFAFVTPQKQEKALNATLGGIASIKVLSKIRVVDY